MDEAAIVLTDYVKYRIHLRGFDLATIEHIVRHSAERYVDTVTGRAVAVGRHDRRLVMIPYEREGNSLTPVTVHATSRQQISLRVKSGRFRNE